MVLFSISYKMVLTVDGCRWMKSYDVTVRMRPTYQYLRVVLIIKLYTMFLNTESADEILKCDHYNKSY